MTDKTWIAQRIEKIDEAIRAMRKDGLLDRWAKQYFGLDKFVLSPRRATLAAEAGAEAAVGHAGPAAATAIVATALACLARSIRMHPHATKIHPNTGIKRTDFFPIVSVLCGKIVPCTRRSKLS